MLHVDNIDQNTNVIDGGRVADNRWTRLKGLIGVKEFSQGDGLLIKPCKGVHCMFMSIPIDVLYISKEDTVIAMDPEMKPNAFGKMHRNCRYVIELPAGTIERTGTEVGHRLKVQY